MYDCYLYLYINPAYIEKRMAESTKNQKYLKYDIADWQCREIEGLRTYCHLKNKDFYVLDCPPLNEYVDAEDALLFLKEIVNGYSNVEYARQIADSILRMSKSNTITLVDGDKTLIEEDSSSFVFEYKTRLFDGNFYSGFQSWKQYNEFEKYEINIPEHIDIHMNPKLPSEFEGNSYILSSVHSKKMPYKTREPLLIFECSDIKNVVFVAKRAEKLQTALRSGKVLHFNMMCCETFL